MAEDRERRPPDEAPTMREPGRLLPVDRPDAFRRGARRRASPPSARPGRARARFAAAGAAGASGEVSLARWDDYGAMAHLERIDYRVQPDVDALLAALAAAEIDLAGAQERSRPARVDEALTIPGLTVFRHGTMNWQHIDLKQLGFLLETPVRQALDFATPRERIIAEILSWSRHPGLRRSIPRVLGL